MSVYGGGGTYHTQIYNGRCVWYGFGTGNLASAKTLSVTVSTDFESSSGGGIGTSVISYSLDGGTTWTTITTLHGTNAAAAYTAAIPSGQDLSQVQVAITAAGGNPTLGGYASMAVDVGTMVIS